jgi:predicted GTPase
LVKNEEEKKSIEEVRISVPNLDGFENKQLKPNMTLLDLPGIEEKATMVEINAYLEGQLAKNSLVPIIIVPLTCGGFDKLT